jgi:hypothetical protein
MANQLYPKGKENFLSGNIDMVNDTITIALVDTASYTFDNTHISFANVTPSAVVANTQLASKSVGNGVFDAADAIFNNVSGNQSEALILFKDTGTNTTSYLIAYIDTATGLPVTPSGGDITVSFSDSTTKIFSL